MIVTCSIESWRDGDRTSVPVRISDVIGSSKAPEGVRVEIPLAHPNAGEELPLLGLIVTHDSNRVEVRHLIHDKQGNVMADWSHKFPFQEEENPF